MLKKFLISIILINIFWNYNYIQAKNKIDNEIVQLYNEYYKIYSDSAKLDYRFDYDKQIINLIDYTLLILKKPEYAYNVLMSFPKDLYGTPQIIEKYKVLKQKYLSELNDPEIDSAEKLLFIRLTLLYPVEFEGDPLINYNEKCHLCIEGLKTMKDKCTNKNYAALATALLFENKETDYCQEFLKVFPEHQAIPEVKLYQISREFDKKNFQLCINQTLDLIKEYGNNVGPDGHTFEISCYEFLISCYLKMNNKAEAYKYYKLIKETAPNNPQIVYLKTIFEITPTIIKKR